MTLHKAVIAGLAILIVVCVFGALAACSTPAVRDRIVVEKVPVATRPIKAADVPTPPSPLPPKPKLANGKTDVSRAGDILLSDHCSWVAFGLKAFPLLRSAAGLPPRELPSYPECER